MNHKFSLLFILFTAILFSQKTQEIQSDPYEYLEDMNSNRTIKWVNEENNITKAYLETISEKYNFKNKISDYIYLSSNAMPNKIGKLFYSKYVKDNKTSPALFYRKNLDDEPIEVFSPNRIYKDPNVQIHEYYPSKNSLKIGLIIDKNGSDLKFAKFVDIFSNKVYDEELQDVKFTDLVWNNDKGVFYRKNSNVNKLAKDSTYTIYYHELGEKQETDKIIYNNTKGKLNTYFFANTTQFFLAEIVDSNTHKIFSANLSSKDFELKSLAEISDVKSIINIDKNKIIYTSLSSDWGDIKLYDLTSKQEKEFIPQIYSYLLEETNFYDHYIFCKYRTREKKYLSVYTDEGVFVKKFEIPIGMDYKIKFYDTEKKEIYASFYSQVLSFYNLILSIETGKIRNYYNDYIIQKPKLFSFDHFSTIKTTYKSKDNTDVPITIIHKKNIELNGQNPTLLEAYGGFGVANKVSYDPGLISFLEKGGVYAYAEIRGGGEYGKEWHRSGKSLNKTNSFNDFIAAAEFLIQKKYTNSNKLAISGASHGGLVVGVALTQRPDLFKVAVPKVGVFDMLKYDKYTVGHYHLNEFGDPKISKFHDNLALYSPYHNIKPDVNYPTTLIITAENDDRVPPLHSYKFAAKLKNRVAQKNKIYLSVQDNSGHNGKISTNKDFLNSEVDFYSFIYDELTK